MACQGWPTFALTKVTERDLTLNAVGGSDLTPYCRVQSHVRTGDPDGCEPFQQGLDLMSHGRPLWRGPS